MNGAPDPDAMAVKVQTIGAILVLLGSLCILLAMALLVAAVLGIV